MADKQCDICGAPMVWTADEVAFDLQLRMRGSGLGAMCSPCSDRQVAIYERMEREDREREERDEEVDAHFERYARG